MPDTYSKHYDKLKLVGDSKAEESDPCLSQFLYEYNTKNIVKEKTCLRFKNNIKEKLISGISNYESFEFIFIEMLNKNASLRKKVLRANHAP